MRLHNHLQRMPGWFATPRIVTWCGGRPGAGDDCTSFTRDRRSRRATPRHSDPVKLDPRASLITVEVEIFKRAKTRVVRMACKGSNRRLEFMRVVRFRPIDQHD